MKQLSDQMLKLLERLAEMFPRQHYQSELERYITSKNPTNAAEVDYWAKRYDHQTTGRNFI